MLVRRLALLFLAFGGSLVALAETWTSEYEGYSVELPAGCVSGHQGAMTTRSCTLQRGRRVLVIGSKPLSGPEDDVDTFVLRGAITAEAEGLGGHGVALTATQIEGRYAVSTRFTSPDLRALDPSAPEGPADVSLLVVSDGRRLYTLTAGSWSGGSNDDAVVTTFFASFHLLAPPPRLDWWRYENASDGFAVDAPGKASVRLLGSTRVYDFAGIGAWAVSVFDCDEETFQQIGGTSEALALNRVNDLGIPNDAQERTAITRGASSGWQVRAAPWNNRSEGRVLVLVRGRRVYKLLVLRDDGTTVTEADVQRFMDSFTVLPEGG